MPEIPLKISRAIICKKGRELRHNNFMGQGESVLCNFAERAPMPKGIENLEKEELRCLIVFILFYFIFFNLKRENVLNF